MDDPSLEIDTYNNNNLQKKQEDYKRSRYKQLLIQVLEIEINLGEVKENARKHRNQKSIYVPFIKINRLIFVICWFKPSHIIS